LPTARSCTSIATRSSTFSVRISCASWKDACAG
jgi:hypothetical protein